MNSCNSTCETAQTLTDALNAMSQVGGRSHNTGVRLVSRVEPVNRSGQMPMLLETTGI